jgi:hypothetical protein
MFWKVRAMPSAGDAVRRLRVRRSGPCGPRLAGRRVDAADQVEHRGLAAPLGPISVNTSPRRTSKLTG